MRTEDLLSMMTCPMQGAPKERARSRDGLLFDGGITVGMVFEWEPDRPVAAETCEVTGVITRPGDERLIKTRGNRHTDKEYTNEESRFREAVVKSVLRFLPTGYT